MGSNFSSNAVKTAHGPRLPTLALQQVGSYLRHSGYEANVVAVTALDPEPTLAQQRRASARTYANLRCEERATDRDQVGAGTRIVRLTTSLLEYLPQRGLWGRLCIVV